MEVGVHQGSALSPLSFIMVIHVLTEDVRAGSPMELLFADDLVLCGGIIKGGYGKVLEMEKCSKRKSSEVEC